MLYKETASKETPVGRIPEDWKAVRIDSISEVHRGASPRPIGDQKYFSVTGRGWIRISDVTGAYKYLGKTDQYLSTLGESKSVKVDPGDLIMSICATIGKPIIIDMKACIHDGFVVFRNLSRDVNAEFLFYFLQKNVRRFRSMKQTGTQGNLNTTLVGETFIPVPSLGEQKGIIEVLGVVDSAIELVDRVVLKTERLKKGLMQELLTKGIGHTEYKDTPIGKTPKTWQTVELGEIIDIMSGQYFKFSEFSEEGVRCLKIDNVGFGKVVWETSTVLPDDYTKQYPELVLNDGDIVLALNRPIIDNKVKVGILKKEDSPSILYQRVGKIIIKDTSKVDRQFLFCTFTGEYFRQQLSHSLIGTDQPYIRTPILLRIKIPLPPVPEQQRIAKILYEVDKKLELERREKASLERVKRGLMDLLLTGKVRVKVD